MENTFLKKRIMRRVYLTFLMRKLREPFIVQMCLLFLLGVSSFLAISIKSIFINTPKTFAFSELYHFYSYAFMHTEVFVKLLIVTLLVLMGWMLQNAISRWKNTESKQTHLVSVS